MNKGTRTRTILMVIILINEALIRIGTIDFGNETSNQIYRWVSFSFLVGSYVASHWYNNDFTVEMDTATKLGREAKAKRDYVPETVEEPEDSYIVESEVEHGNE